MSDFEGLIVEDVDRWDDKDLVNLWVDLEINMIGKYFKVPRLVFWVVWWLQGRLTEFCVEIINDCFRFYWWKWFKWKTQWTKCVQKLSISPWSEFSTAWVTISSIPEKLEEKKKLTQTIRYLAVKQIIEDRKNE